MPQGRFITFEGGEGSGKSTQIALLGEKLTQAGHDVLLTREPGGTRAAEEIRALLVEGAPDRWDPYTETLLFYAARSEHVKRCVFPALSQEKIVLCDRFADSTLIYQGIGKAVARSFMTELHRLVLEGLTPDITFILDVEVDTGLARAAKRRGKETRFETMDREFHARIRQGFRELAAAEPQRCALIDANGSAEEVHGHILSAWRERSALALHPENT